MSSMLSDQQIWFALVELEFELCPLTSQFRRIRWIARRLTLVIALLVKDTMVSFSNETLKQAIET